MSIAVGEKPLKVIIVGMNIPNPIDLTPPRRRIGFSARNEISEHMSDAPRLRKGKGVVEGFDKSGRRGSFVNRSAPSDVTGIVRLNLRQEMAAHLGLRTARTHKQGDVNWVMPGNVRAHGFALVFKSEESGSSVVTLVGESRPQGDVDGFPGCETLRHRLGLAVGALGVEVAPDPAGGG